MGFASWDLNSMDSQKPLCYYTVSETIILAHTSWDNREITRANTLWYNQGCGAMELLHGSGSGSAPGLGLRLRVKYPGNSGSVQNAPALAALAPDPKTYCVLFPKKVMLTYYHLQGMLFFKTHAKHLEIASREAFECNGTLHHFQSRSRPFLDGSDSGVSGSKSWL